MVAQRMHKALARSSTNGPQAAFYDDSCVGLTGPHGDSCQLDGLLVVVTGRPSWNHPELAQLAMEQGLARSLAIAYRTRDKSILGLLRGPFALALINPKEEYALLATDRMAVCPLLYSRQHGRLAFASTADAIVSHPAMEAQIDSQGLYNYVYFHMVPGPESVYRQLHSLGPGQYLRLQGGAIETAHYWEPVFQENSKAGFGDLKAEFRELLHQSVSRQCEGADVGAFLSGGTDSSTIAGILAEVRGSRAKTYSIGFDAEGYDEMEYARIAAKHFGTEHHEYYVTPDDVVNAIPMIADAYALPYGNASAVPTYYCARLAKDDGREALLGGDGGDELFGGNARYAKQHIFELYNNVPTFLRTALIQPTLLSTPIPARIPFARKLRSYVEQAMVPMPGRMETYNLVHRLGIDNMFDKNFLGAVDPNAPLSLLNNIYDNAKARTLINKMLAVDFQITLADNDLPKVVGMTQAAGVEARFPLLDDELVAFSTRLNPRLKLKGTKLRYFFKEALRDFLPEEIINKRKHGFGLPFGPWVRTHKPLQELVYDSLNQLKRRRIFRPEFIDGITDSYLESHPGYYGTMVWVMMMLELWHQKHIDKAPYN